MSVVRDDVVFDQMTKEEQALVRMWCVMGAPVEYYSEGLKRWHEYNLDHRPSPAHPFEYFRYRLKPQPETPS